MLIRPLVQEDRGKIRRLIGQRKIFTAKEIKVAMELVDDALHHGKKSDYRILCAMQGSRIFAGYICFGPIPLTEKCYDLYWIAVNKKYARRGIGENLLRHMENIITGERGRQIYIETSSSPGYEAARAFYIKHGYRPICTVNDFYRQGDHKLIFVKEVDNNVRSKRKIRSTGKNPQHN